MTMGFCKFLFKDLHQEITLVFISYANSNVVSNGKIRIELVDMLIYIASLSAKEIQDCYATKVTALNSRTCIDVSKRQSLELSEL